MKIREFICKHPKLARSIPIVIAAASTLICTKSKHKESIVKQSISEVQSEPIVSFHGIPLSDLSELAKEIYHGISCSIDKSGFLIYKYRTNSGKTCDAVQIALDETGILKNLGRRYPGQVWSSADAFIKRANEKFKFTK